MKIFTCDEYYPAMLEMDFCSLNALKWKFALLTSVVLFVINIFLLHKWKYRCYKTLLTYHNLRATIVLLLFIINTLELTRAFLPTPTSVKFTRTTKLPTKLSRDTCNEDYIANSNCTASTKETNIDVAIIVGWTNIWNALTALLLTIMLLWLHRIIELKKALRFLYVSGIICGIVFMIRLLNMAEIFNNDPLWELEPFLESTSTICLLSIGVIDVLTVYKERYRLDYLEDYERIGYKHTLATFYSKLVFFWLNPLLLFGFREPLELDDLGQMRLEDSARAHYDHFLFIYKTAKVKINGRSPSLWFCYLRNSWHMFTLGGILKLFGDLTALIGPLAIQQIVHYIDIMYKNHSTIMDANHIKDMANESVHIDKYNKNSIINEQSKDIKENMHHWIVNKFRIPSPVNLNDIRFIDHILLHSFRNRQMYSSKILKSAATIFGYKANNSGIDDITVPEGFTNYDSVNGTDVGVNLYIYSATWLDLLSNGWCIAWLVLLAALAQGALSQASTHILNMNGIRIKTSLQGLIYRKSLLLHTCYVVGVGDKRCENNGAGVKKETITKSSLDDSFVDKNDETSSKVANNCDLNTESSQNKQYHESNQSKENEKLTNTVGAITNLMTEDTTNIMSFFWIAHYVWAIPLKIIVIIYLLYLKLGVSAVLGSIVCIFTMTPLQFFIGKIMSKNMDTLAKHTDDRLKLIYDVLLGIKTVKLIAWDKVFSRRISSIREKELTYLNKDSFYWTLMTIFIHISIVLITCVTLAIYVNENSQNDLNLSAGVLFSSLALFQQLTVPLLIFPITVPIIIAAVTSTKRLEEFLQAEEIQKHYEGIRNMARILSKSDASLDMYEQYNEFTNIRASPINTLERVDEHQLSDLPSLDINAKCSEDDECNVVKAPLASSEPHTPLASSIPVQPPQFPVDLQQGKSNQNDHTSTINSKKSQKGNKELLRNSPYVLVRPRKAQFGIGGPSTSNNTSNVSYTPRKYESWHRESVLLKMPDNVAVSIRDGIFSWQSNLLQKHTQTNDYLLHIPELSVPRSRLTVIVGKNGSGKTSLLSGLLMEMPLISGDMVWMRTSTIAYVPQFPWLFNATIRENILFGESYRPRRYEYVLSACALNADIALMPSMDATVVGERGICLSDGQRQRIAIARALYSSANVVIMDDPFSSLDNEVARHIFEQSIKNMLLNAQRTVILVTHQFKFAEQADYLIVLKDGQIHTAGCFKDIDNTKWNSVITAARDTTINAIPTKYSYNDDSRDNTQHPLNVKVGLQRSISLTTQSKITGGETIHSDSTAGYDGFKLEVAKHCIDEDITSDKDENDVVQNDDIFPTCDFQNIFGNSSLLHNYSMKSTRKRSSIYGSRHLIYDVPLPIDELQPEDVVMRRGRRRRSSMCSNSTHSCESGTTATVKTDSTKIPKLSSIKRSKLAEQQNSDRFGGHSPTSDTSKRDLSAEISISASSFDTQGNTLQSSNFNIKSKKSATQAKRSALSWQPLEIQENKLLSHQMVTRHISSPSSLQQYEKKPQLKIPNCTEKNSQSEIVNSSIISFSSDDAIKSITEEVEQEENVDGRNYQIKTTKTLNDEVYLDTRTQDKVSVTNSTIIMSQNTIQKQFTPNTIRNDSERKYGTTPINIYWLYVKASRLKNVVTFFIGALIWQCLRVYADVLLQQWTNYTHIPPHAIVNTTMNASKIIQYNKILTMRNATELEQSPEYKVTYYFGVYAAISCVCIIMAIISTLSGQFAGCRARQDLHEQFLNSIICKSLHFFDVTPIGRLMNRFSTDMAIIDKKIAATSQRLLQFTLLCMCAILINVSVTPWFILVTIPICAIYYAIQKFYRCSSRELQRIESLTTSPIISHLSETIQGVTTIRAFNQESRFTETLFKYLESNTVATSILNASNRWLGIALDFLGGIIVFVAILTALVTSYFSYSQHFATSIIKKLDKPTILRPTPSLIGLAINYTLLIPIYLNWVVKLFADMEMYIGSVERFAFYIDQNITINEKSVKVDSLTLGTASDVEEKIESNANQEHISKPITHVIPTNTKTNSNHSTFHEQISRENIETHKKQYKNVAISWPHQCNITFKEVSLRYEGCEKDVVKNLTLHIPAGQRLGICGRTGCGKSSLALSLFGGEILQTTRGCIQIDDLNITDIHPDEIRSRLSLIPHDAHLFNATIRENLDLPGYYSDLALWNCLEMAQLKEFVLHQMPQGLDTKIMDDGIYLSIGHRQLLCLARAILRESFCLILDEATSALDEIVENDLLTAAHKAFRGRTIISIAHRLSTIIDYDRIIVLENGSIVEDGRPTELLSKKENSKFYNLLYSCNEKAGVNSDVP